jgi:DNA helicase HerA-like ATPase
MTACLEIDVNRKVRLEPQIDIVGRRIAILGVSGQGKSNTAAVLIEELLSSGFPLTIVDLEGEYWGLKEQFQILVVGRGEHVDLVAGPFQAAALAAASIMESIPVILDLSDFSEDEMTAFLLEYFGSLWEAAGRQRTPYEVILEEAHEFLPETVKNPLKELLTRIALRGRKRGLGSIIMSQRSAKVAKDFLTQAEMLFLHRVIHPVDLKVYKELIPLPAREVTDMVGNLQTGQVVFVYNNEAQQLQIRPRHTFSAGATPQLEEQVASNLKTIDHALLEKLAEAIKVEPEELGERSSKEARQARRVKELEDENAAIRATVEDLQRQLSTLKDLKVTMDGPLVVPVA